MHTRSCDLQLKDLLITMQYTRELHLTSFQKKKKNLSNAGAEKTHYVKVMIKKYHPCKRL